MKVSELKPLEKNPFKSVGDEQIKKIAKSIQEFERMMEIRRIVIDEENNILGGNKRYFALKKLGYKEIPDAWIEKVEGLTKEQKKEFIVKDNAHWGSEWDLDILKDWNVDLEAWGINDLNWGEAKILEAKEDNFEIPDEIETDIVLGDLFEIGEHRLLCGDSTLVDTYKKITDGHLVDMILTDPPYNVAYEGGTIDKLTIQNDSMSNDDFYNFLYNFYTSCATVSKRGSAIYVWHATSEIINFAKAMVDGGWLLKQQLIWVKNSMVMGRQDYQWKHEPCLYGWLTGGSHNWYSDRKQTTVINFDRPQRNGEHPTMKPVGLFAYLIQNSSKTDDIVLDPFGGSGTTMVACHQLNRRSMVIEYDPKYCDVIVKRMIKLDPDLRIKRNGVDITNEWNI